MQRVNARVICAAVVHTKNPHCNAELTTVVTFSGVKCPSQVLTSSREILFITGKFVGLNILHCQHCKIGKIAACRLSKISEEAEATHK
jgi:hypothetical protein